MQNLRENNFEIKRNLNWSARSRINLPTVMVEWLFNSELPSLKESELSKYMLFKLFSFVFYHCRFYAFFIFDSNATDATMFTMTWFCNMLFDVTSCYWKSLCKMPSALFLLEHLSFIELWTKNLTNRIAGKLMNIEKIKSFINEYVSRRKLMVVTVEYISYICQWPRIVLFYIFAWVRRSSFGSRSDHWSPMVAISGNRRPLVPIGVIYFRGSVAIDYHWYRSVQMTTNVCRRWEKTERTQWYSIFIMYNSPDRKLFV